MDAAIGFADGIALPLEEVADLAVTFGAGAKSPHQSVGGFNHIPDIKVTGTGIVAPTRLRLR
jgi:hypothetical protein